MSEPVAVAPEPAVEQMAEQVAERLAVFAARRAAALTAWGVRTTADVAGRGARWGVRRALGGAQGPDGDRVPRRPIQLLRLARQHWADEHGSVWSTDSRLSIGSVKSHQSLLSAWSLFSLASVASFGSAGSVLSIGSAGSVLSIGSAGSILSIGSAGSILAIGGVNQRPAALERLLDPGEQRRLVHRGAVMLGALTTLSALLDR